MSFTNCRKLTQEFPAENNSFKYTRTLCSHDIFYRGYGHTVVCLSSRQPSKVIPTDHSLDLKLAYNKNRNSKQKNHALAPVHLPRLLHLLRVPSRILFTKLGSWKVVEDVTKRRKIRREEHPKGITKASTPYCHPRRHTVANPHPRLNTFLRLPRHRKNASP